MKKIVVLILAVVCSACSDSGPNSAFGDCSYLEAGNLVPNSGEGARDARVWAPGIVSPFGKVKAVAKSQVYSPGGAQSGSQDQCASQNFITPHRDTFCETRSADRDSLNCPKRNVHLGIDINAGTRDQCLLLEEAKVSIDAGGSPTAADIIPVRAVSDGVVSYIGQYTVDLRPSTGAISRFRYLHMNMRTLKVEFGDQVKRGDIIGYYYNDFAGNQTTFHLHFEMIAFVNGAAQYVSPYMSFIKAEERSKGVTCENRGNAA